MKIKETIFSAIKQIPKDLLPKIYLVTCCCVFLFFYGIVIAINEQNFPLVSVLSSLALIAYWGQFIILVHQGKILEVSGTVKKIVIPKKQNVWEKSYILIEDENYQLYEIYGIKSLKKFEVDEKHYFIYSQNNSTKENNKTKIYSTFLQKEI